MTIAKKILCLCGGVGGAKLAYGLSQTLSADELLIVVNTGDDFTHLGLHISPDLDSVMYALAGINDQERGWGIADESWQFMQMLSEYNAPGWFNLGDKDLATHVQRTQALQQSVPLDKVTKQLCSALGISHQIVPMSNDPVSTLVDTADGVLSFQDYFVRLQCEPEIRSISFQGVEQARPQTDFIYALDTASAVIICPSNPFLSVDPILTLPDVRQRLTKHKVFAVSPIIQGTAIKGPAAKMMQELNLAVTNISIAEHYKDILDYLIIDESDQDDIAGIESLGIKAVAMPTLMKKDTDKIALAMRLMELVTNAST